MAAPLFEGRNFAEVKRTNPRLGEWMEDVQNALINIAQQTASNPQGQQPSPPAPSFLNVTAVGGIFDITITDNNPAVVGLAPEYFLEYSTSASFSAVTPTIIHLGPARQYRAHLGNQTLFWRCYSQYGRASNSSPFCYFGPQNSPTPVVGGGAIAGPNPLASTGSGTGTTDGREPGIGYGRLGRLQF